VSAVRDALLILALVLVPSSELLWPSLLLLQVVVSV
jgi:hypothetical protein